MNNHQKIKLIETKIKEIKSALTLWTNNIATYQQQLEKLTNQLQAIRKQVKENQIK